MYATKRGLQQNRIQESSEPTSLFFIRFFQHIKPSYLQPFQGAPVSDAKPV
jgi:hypothetical protein